MKKLSIIIVTYNSDDTLGNCLESILNQNLPRSTFEVIVVDNGSQDESVETARSHKLRPSVIAWGRNLGFGIGNNLGVQFSNTPLLVFVNPDSILKPNALFNLLNHFDNNKINLGIVGGQLSDSEVNIRPYPSPKSLLSYHRGSFKTINKSGLIDLPWVCGAFLSIPKSIFQSIGGFDEDYFLYYEETDLCKKVMESGHRVCMATDVRAEHLGGTSAKKVKGGIDATQRMIPRFRFLSYMIFMRKHYGTFGAFITVLAESFLKSLRLISSFRKHSQSRTQMIQETLVDLKHLLRSAIETRLGNFVPQHPWSTK